jgi:NAD(P)H-dependent FMN reductase
VTAVLYDQLADLPAFNPDDEDREPVHPAVTRLREELGAADAVLFCTPEYAGSLPGSFKNLLDWTVGTGDLDRKPVAWVTVAPEGRGEGALATLATVLRYVGADVVETACMRLPVARQDLGPDGTVTDPELRASLARTLDTLARAARTTAT